MSVGLLDAADEADGFGERDGVGKGLREGAVAREFEDAVLAELEGAEVLLVVGEAGLGGRRSCRRRRRCGAGSW